MKKNILLILVLSFISAIAWTQPSKGSNKNSFFYKGQLTLGVQLQNCAAINSPSLDFSPAFYQNGVVFVSSRYKNGPIDEKTGETYLELFYADVDPNGTPLKPDNFSLQINSQLHEGPVTFNRTGDRIFFTRNNTNNGVIKADAKGKVGLKIFEAQKGYYDWENIRELPFNNDSYSCMHPALSPDGNKLFFASDMPGGFGGRDLYFVEKQGNTWSKPINLGAEINTEKDEGFPFFHESGILFFASDGHAGMGGLDIFMIDLSKRAWGQVINIGEPFNSSNDDLGFILSEEGKRGYFASNRAGGYGKDDIYFFEAPNGLHGVEVADKMNVFVAVSDASTSKRLASVAIRLFERSSDGLMENEDLYNVELVPSSENLSDFVFKMVRKKDSELGNPTQLTNRIGEVVLPVDYNKDYTIIISKEGYTTQEIKYSSKNNFSGRPVEVALQPSNCLALTGIAISDKFNQTIPNARVKIVNQCTGKTDMVNTNVEGKFEYCLEIGCDFSIVAEKDGYTQAISDISTVKIRGNRSVNIELKMNSTSDLVLRKPIREGTVIILQNIYYDFNKSFIRTGSDADLEALAKLMKQYPSMEIELIAHTDSRGNETYNLALSLKRAESAKQFLVSRGIESKRIKAFGYGEAKLRNHCKDDVDCTEKEHEYNRRTEVLITRVDEKLEFDQPNDKAEVLQKKG